MNFLRNIDIHNYSRYRILALLFVTIQIPVFSQQNRIEGRILDGKSNEPVIGATVFLANEKTGTVSNVDGKFTVNVQSFPATLSVSYVGYKTSKSELYESNKSLIILLQEDAGLLNEVVVVGYGTQRRKELTGAIATVSSSVLQNVRATSLDGLLGGAVAGLNVTQSSGQPGASSNIRIRGGNSINASNEPLFVIDGILFYNDVSSNQAGLAGIQGSLNPLAAINPLDIESIEVLKDASATAIYGSRGSNGVIMVTTKQGKRNGNHINYQFTTGWQQRAKRLDLMNGEQWMRLQNQLSAAGIPAAEGSPFDEEAIRQTGQGSDWQNAIFRTGHTQEHYLSISGGDDNTKYSLAGNYSKTGGIILNTDYERYNVRINLEKRLYPNLTVGVNTTANKSTQNSLTAMEDNKLTYVYKGRGITNSLNYATRIPPIVAIYKPDGSYNYYNPYEGSDLHIADYSPNPVSDLNKSIGQVDNTAALGNFFAQYTIIPGLTAKANLGVNYSNSTQRFFAPRLSAAGMLRQGYGGIGNKRFESYLAEYTLNYSHLFNKIHSINLLAGYTTQENKVYYSVGTSDNYTREDVAKINILDGELPYVESDEIPTSMTSVIGRVNYSLLNRYNLTATIRGDKSTKFAPGHQWGYFPSIGVSWNISEEDFLRDSKVVNNLKLRFSAGKIGNSEIAPRLWDPSRFIPRKDGPITIYVQENMGNLNLTWEKTTQYNAGIDLGLWEDNFYKDRLIVTVDAYTKETTDLLYNKPLDPTVGALSQMTNIGSVTNKGIEFAVSSSIIDRKNFNWTLSANIARNINTITDLGEQSSILMSDAELKEHTDILQVGKSLGAFYGYKFDGVVQLGENVNALPIVDWKNRTPHPGEPKYVDINHDNRITEDDKVVLGSIQPDFTYGFSSVLTYRYLELYIGFQGSQGNKIHNKLRKYLEDPSKSYNASTALLDSWTPENPSNYMPQIGASTNSHLDSRYVEDASYLRLKNVALTYTLPINVKHLVPVRFRIFASAQNLLTITRYKGYDPEIADGTDLGVYPVARSFSVGVGLTF